MQTGGGSLAWTTGNLSNILSHQMKLVGLGRDMHRFCSFYLNYCLHIQQCGTKKKKKSQVWGFSLSFWQQPVWVVCFSIGYFVMVYSGLDILYENFLPSSIFWELSSIFTQLCHMRTLEFSPEGYSLPCLFRFLVPGGQGQCAESDRVLSFPPYLHLRFDWTSRLREVGLMMS